MKAPFCLARNPNMASVVAGSKRRAPPRQPEGATTGLAR